MDIALRRLADQLKARSATQASEAAAAVAGEASDAAAAEVDAHSAQRQFVHGVGPLYVAKTKNPDQYVDWSEIKNKPSTFPGAGGIDPETLEIDGDQVTTGTVNINRLPVASAGETSGQKLVRSDDPRLAQADIAVVTTGEALQAGDFVRIVGGGSAALAYKADATDFAHAAVGFVAASVGAGEGAPVYPTGENVCAYLEDAALTDLGRTVFLSTTPGRISRTPPVGAGQLLQPLGTVTAIHSGTVVSVLVRYEYRFRL
ncbi:hypothetical protein K2Z83_11290 [Oscillochloris sp. ZM17-4]|uniref:hypothetical protein n=1 Tax=Oscillochloris sp. ZM17-4 TaxID=2866714 RepID=UPI001C73BE1D|nr:hypothetical protein [Oscillochloris sp. ZM17-4]MBX0328260.1 hypothetical protein [Oscillochloris sp. ZM17-4]